LKLADVIDTGGAVKWFLQEYEVYVNNELENRRGRKLYANDVIEIPGSGTFQVQA
ncbi:RNA-binding S4 domain-containing protein, partial [Bacillus sp. HC-TM]